MYQAVGLNVKLKMFETGVYRQYDYQPYPKNVGPYVIHKTHDNNNGDAVFTVSQQYSRKGRSGSTCDKTLDDLIEKAQVAVGEERRNLWRSTFKRIHEEIVSNVFLYHLVAYSRSGKRINFKPTIATCLEIPLAEITFK